MIAMNEADIKTTPDNICDDCRAVIPGGRAGCQKLFEKILVRKYSDYNYGKIHRLTVDTYSLQHPEAYMKSGKSFAAHLTGICSAIEYENSKSINQAIQKWLNGARKIDKPASLPEYRGELTIMYIHSAKNGEEHIKHVQEWSCSVWNTWSEYHSLSRQWINEATLLQKQSGGKGL